MTNKTPCLAIVALIFLLAAARVHAQTGPEWQYSIKRGDNPWRITERLLDGMKYWTLVQQHNGIVDPLNMVPGTTLRIPIDWLRTEPGYAVVLTTSADGCLVPDGAENRSVHKGDRLATGKVLRSTSGGRCTLQFPDQSKILLLENSALRLERMITYAATGMHDIASRLLRGRVETTVTPASGPASRFEINSPQGVTSVRGTVFRVASREVDAQAEVIEGRVDVRNSLGQVALEAGTGTVFSQAATPSAPTPLLNAPVLDSLPANVRPSQQAVMFTPVPGAAAYRQQFAGDASFDLPLSDARTEVAQLLVPALAEGEYFVRIRAIDTLGLEGRDALHPLRIEHLLPAPTACSPADGGRVQGRIVATRCQAVPEAQWYRVQMARSQDFSLPQVDWLRTEPIGELTLDKPGQYFWRVAAIDKSGREGDFSAPMSLLRALDPPALELLEITRESLTFGWKPQTPAHRYRLQLAGDRSFHDLLEDHTTAGGRLVVARPKMGAYFARVAILENDADDPVFGPIHGINIPPVGTLDWLPPLGLVFLFLL